MFDEATAKNLFEKSKVLKKGKWTGGFYPDEYKVWLGYMNNFFCQFAYPSSFAIRVNINDRFQFRNAGELASQMGSGNAHGSMVYHWIRDTDRKNIPQ